MAQGVLVVGESGAGKSTAIESLNPSETFIINVAGKGLPFRGWKNKYKTWHPTENPSGNAFTTAAPQVIIDALNYVSKKRPEVKNIIIDDLQYMSAFDFFDSVDEKGYDKFTRIGGNLVKIAKMIKDLREDLIVFITMHSEETIDFEGRRKLKAKTIGKMVDEKLSLEGLFTIVLFARVKKNKDAGVRYVFDTQNSGENTCKSPRGMFPTPEIDNNFQLVRDEVIAYETGEVPVVKA